MKNNNPTYCCSFAGWLLFVMLTVLLPAACGWLAWGYIESVSAESNLRRFQVEANDRLERLRLSSDSGKYACILIDDVFKKSKNPAHLGENIARLNVEMSLKLNYLVWNPDGTVASATFDWQKTGADWAAAFTTLFSIGHGGRQVISASETANLRRIYGPQFFPELHMKCYGGRNISPVLGESSTDGRKVWIKTHQRMGLTVFFSNAALNGLPGIEHQIREMTRNSEMLMATIVDGVLQTRQSVDLNAQEIELINNSVDNPLRVRDWYVFKSLVKTGVTGICLLPARLIERIPRTTAVNLLLLVLGLLATLLVQRSYMVFCRGRSANLNIRKQLIILFILSNALSLMILAILGFDYLRQYSLLLQAETFGRGMTYLQSIDEMYVREYTVQLRRLENSLVKLKERLLTSHPERKMLIEFINAQQPYPFRMLLIGSHTPFIGSELGIMHSGEFVQQINMDYARFKSMKVLIDAMGKLGQYYLSMLNRESLSEILIAQVEMIAESLGQLRSIEMYQEFFAATGSFWKWGMGWRFYPAFIQVLHLFDPARADYVLLYLWEARTLEQEYIKSMFTDLNRNPLGIKIMAVNEDFSYSYPEELLQHDQLRTYSTKLREKTGTEIDFCEWAGEKHLLMGLKCTSLGSVRLLGLFPMSDIESKVHHKLLLFIAFAFVSMLVSLALSLFVSRSILGPLGELQSGVLALRKQDFAFRLPDLGGDEFGHLAQIFNTTLVDLEELHTASMVQEKLVDSMTEVQRHGRFSFYGGSVNFASFGGDFFSVIRIDDRYSGIFIGDVAGNGVAASLVMAFVKACILQLADLYMRPCDLLMRIDALVRESSAGKQRKFMTLQYALLDGETSAVEVAGAGHCFPLRLFADGRLQQVPLPSTPLGAGKAPRCTHADFVLSPGERLILYTAGLYRNGDLGFERLSGMICACSAADPRVFHEEILKGITAIVPRSECSDDMTMAVITSDTSIE